MIHRSRQAVRTQARLALALGALLFGAGPSTAAAQESEAPVCLAKTDETGGRLGFIVRESEATIFESVGFQRIACPDSLDEAATTLAARCVRFRALDDPGKQTISELYGLTVEEMCAATDAWVQTRAGG